MEFTAKAIAEMIGGTVEGNPETTISKLAKIETGEPGALSFLANPKYNQYLYNTQSSVVIISNDFSAERIIPATLIRVADPYTAFATLLDMYNKLKTDKKGISSLAFVSQTAKIGSGVYIGEFAVIGENVVIGDNSKIYPQVYVGDNSKVGNDTTIFAGAKVYHECEIGSNCTLHSGVVIGADGFGFAPQDDNNYQKVAQIGNVILEDNVEVGANTTIDRATLGSTFIRKGVKLDNLIQVAHNVEIGNNTVIAALTGIAGSSKIGKNSMIGGQVGISGHITLADDIKIGAQAGIPKSVTQPGVTLLGAPAVDISKFRRLIAVFNNLDKMALRLSEAENEIKRLKNENAK